MLKKIIFGVLLFSMIIIMTICLSDNVREKFQDEDNALGNENSGITKNEINRYFDMTKSELLEILGTNYQIVPAGGEGTEDGYYYEGKGIFVFSYDDRLWLMYVPADFEVNGAMEGMNFEQIQKCLGETEIKDVFIETPDHPAYEIEYISGNCIYGFWSYDKDGNNSMLTIRRNYLTE